MLPDPWGLKERDFAWRVKHKICEDPPVPSHRYNCAILAKTAVILCPNRSANHENEWREDVGFWNTACCFLSQNAIKDKFLCDGKKFRRHLMLFMPGWLKNIWWIWGISSDAGIAVDVTLKCQQLDATWIPNLCLEISSSAAKMTFCFDSTFRCWFLNMRKSLRLTFRNIKF